MSWNILKNFNIMFKIYILCSLIQSILVFILFNYRKMLVILTSLIFSFDISSPMKNKLV